MNKTCEYIAKIKKHCGVKSDYAVAHLLGVGRSSMSHYKKGVSMFDDYTAAKAAELLNIDPLTVIADINADRAKRDGERKFWQNIAKRAPNIAAGVAGLSLCLIVGVSAPTSSQAALTDNGPSIHYAKWIKRLLERLRDFFDRLPSRSMLPSTI